MSDSLKFKPYNVRKALYKEPIMSKEEILQALSSGKWLKAFSPCKDYKSLEGVNIADIADTSKDIGVLDMLIVANTGDDTVLHDFDIRLDEEELTKENGKFPIHKDYTDYIWLVVPYTLKDLAPDYMYRSSGLISIQQIGDKLEATVIKKPECLGPDNKDELLQILP